MQKLNDTEQYRLTVQALSEQVTTIETNMLRTYSVRGYLAGDASQVTRKSTAFELTFIPGKGLNLRHQLRADQAVEDLNGPDLALVARFLPELIASMDAEIAETHIAPAVKALSGLKSLFSKKGWA